MVSDFELGVLIVELTLAGPEVQGAEPPQTPPLAIMALFRL